jgi:hypothetical protein
VAGAGNGDIAESQIEQVRGGLRYRH